VNIRLSCESNGSLLPTCARFECMAPLEKAQRVSLWVLVTVLGDRYWTLGKFPSSATLHACSFGYRPGFLKVQPSSWWRGNPGSSTPPSCIFSFSGCVERMEMPVSVNAFGFCGELGLTYLRLAYQKSMHLQMD